MAKTREIEAERPLGSLPLTGTGSLACDVVLVKDWLDAALRDCQGIETVGVEGWAVLDHDDPMKTIGQLASYVSTLNVQLMAQGFRPPRITYDNDPMGFLRENVAFLSNIAPLVIDPPVTRH